MANRIAIYPGTFDPITNGHMSLVQRASSLFDNLLVAVSESVSKNPMFTFDERYNLVKESLVGVKNVEVIRFHGLLADLATNKKACAIIRGLRVVSDFESEFQMALMNRKIAPTVETVFLMPALSWVYLSSTIVKDVAINGGDVSDLVPDPIAKAIYNKIK